VDKHDFPRSFRFHVKKHASQKQRQRQKAHQPSSNLATQKQSKKNVKAKNASQQQIPEATTTSLETQTPQGLATQNLTDGQQVKPCNSFDFVLFMNSVVWFLQPNWYSIL